MGLDGKGIGPVQDTPSYHHEQLCQVIWNSMLAFRSYAPHKVQKAIFWPLTLLCDLDHEARLPKHVFCTSSWSGQYSCQIISKSFKRFERYRADTICDGQTDGRPGEKQYVSPIHRMGGDIINSSRVMGLDRRVDLVSMIIYAKFQLHIYHSVKDIRLRKTLNKGDNSWI